MPSSSGTKVHASKPKPGRPLLKRLVEDANDVLNGTDPAEKTALDPALKKEAMEFLALTKQGRDEDETRDVMITQLWDKKTNADNLNKRNTRKVQETKAGIAWLKEKRNFNPPRPRGKSVAYEYELMWVMCFLLRNGVTNKTRAARYTAAMLYLVQVVGTEDFDDFRDLNAKAVLKVYRRHARST